MNIGELVMFKRIFFLFFLLNTYFLCASEIIITEYGINNLKIGDGQNKTKEIMGTPNYIFKNEFRNNIKKFIQKYFNAKNDTQEGYSEFFGSLNFFKEGNNIVVFTQPFFSYSYLYYDTGIVIFFDDEDKIVQFIFISNDFEIYLFNDKNQSNTEHWPSKIVEGKIDFLNISLNHSIKDVISKITFDLREKYDIVYNPDIINYKNLYTTDIYFYKLDMIFYYSSKYDKLYYLSIYSKEIGGIKALEALQ